LTSQQLYNCDGAWHSPTSDRLNNTDLPYYYVGENVGWQWVDGGQTASGAQLAGVVDNWVGQLNEYNFGRWGSSCTRTHSSGEFTQVMWARTESLGCEALRCRNTDAANNVDTDLVVCHYGPGGNIRTHLPFSPTTATFLGLDSVPCDGAMDDAELREWQAVAVDLYGVPQGAAGLLGHPVAALVVLFAVVP